MTNRIGRYEIQEELGRGGFGRVYRAFDPTVGRLVAIKTLNTSGEQDTLTRFRNEAAAAGRLHHQNIVIVYDFGEHDGSPFLVMELLDGEDIERIISNNRPLTLLKKLDVMMQAAAGLHHAHSKGIVHRDVKPANIMLLADGSVKIMDFGIALLTQATSDRITPQGSMIGTLPYMAPEQFFGSASSAMTDIFAFGVTCYKLLTGKHPFQSAELGAMMNNIANVQQAPLRTLDPECPEALEQVVNKLLAKNPELRYQSLEDARYDLEAIVVDLRKESLGGLLAEARDLIASDQLENAQSMVRQIFEIDPGNRTARELRETIQRQIKDRVVRPRISALVTAGREQLVGRQFDDAIQKFESALSLDKSNSELQRLIEQARAAAERARRADRLVEEAQQALHREDFTAAHKNIVEALSADPEHARAESLLGDVRQRMESRRHEQQLRDGLNHLKGLMLLQSFSEAIDAAIGLQEQFPESAEVAKILTKARQEREVQTRREQVQTAVAEARELLRSHRFQEAVQRLAQLQKEFPEAAELRDLASYAAREVQAEEQAQIVSRATAETRSLVAAGDFDTALERLERVLAEYPSLNALRDLVQSVASKKAEHQRTAALDDALHASRALVNEDRFSEAIERIDSFIRAYGDSSSLDPVRKQAEEGLELQRKGAAVRKLMADAQAFLDQGRPGTATRVLQQGTIQFPGDRELAKLLGVAETNLREQQQTEAVSKIITEAESMARSKRFDQALEIINEGQRRYPAVERLARCRGAITASQAGYQRDQARRETVERVRLLRSLGKATEALQAIESALANGIEDEALLTFKREIENEIAGWKRAEEIQRTLARAQSLLDGGRVEPAREILQEATRLYPSEAKVTALLAVAEVRVKAAELRKAGRIAEAIQTVDIAVKRLGADAGLAALQLDLEAESQSRQIDEEAQEAIRRAKDFLAGNDPASAVQTLQRAPSQSLHREQIARVLQTAEGKLKEKQREQSIAAVAEEVNQARAQGQVDQALRTVEQGLQQFSGADVLLRLQRSLLADKARADSLAEARQLYRDRQFEAALQEVRKALQAAPADSEFTQLKANIEADQAKEERATAIRRTVVEAQSALQADRLDHAFALLQQYPDEKQISELRRTVEEEIERRRRAQELEQARAQAESLLSQRRYEDAVALIEGRFANEPGLQELLGRAKKEVEAKQRDAMIENAIAIGKEKRYQEAIQVVDQAVSRYGPTETTTKLRQSLQASLDQQLRRQARERDQAQLLSIEQQVGTQPRKGRLKKFAAEAEGIAARYEGDAEIVEIVNRIRQASTAVPIVTEPAEKKPSVSPWIWIAGAGGVAVLTGGIAFFLRSPSPTPITAIPVEIHTSPPGAAIHINQQSCFTPNCRFELKPGQYQLDARLNGYQPIQQTVNVEPAKGPRVVDLTLEPLPPPPPPPVTDGSVAIGTLVVQTGVGNAVVYVDGTPRSRTDSSGSLTLPLEAKAHEVSVERDGYEKPAAKKVSLAKGSRQVVTFSLLPQSARVELRGAPRGVEVRAGGKLLGTTNGSATFVFPTPVGTGDQTLQLTLGSANRSIQHKFEPGQTVRLEWKDVLPSPPPPNAEAIEKQDWERVRGSSDVAQLRGYLSSHPNGPHAGEAASRIADLAWTAVDQNNIDAVRRFARENPDNPHKLDAQRLIDQADAAQQRLAQQEREKQDKANREKAKQEEAKLEQLKQAQAKQERSKADSARKQQVLDAIRQLDAALQRKRPAEVKAVWPGTSSTFLESLRSPQVEMSLAIRDEDVEFPQADRAVVHCDLVTRIKTSGSTPKRQRATVTLHNAGTIWMVDQMRVD